MPFEGETGLHNAITDVPGVEVGFSTIVEPAEKLVVGEGPVRTGVTAILPRGKGDRLRPTWAGHFNLNGNGEMTGTHWINEAGYFVSPVLITNTHSVGMVHHAAVGWMIDQYPADFIEAHSWAMPVVAETYDGMANDICGRHVTEAHAVAALNNAAAGPVAEGNVGGGTGMQTYEFKGGTGTASRIVAFDSQNYTVGALVQSNFGARAELKILGVPVGQEIPEGAFISEDVKDGQGSIIVILGTDLPLSQTQLQRLAKRGAMGIARTGSPGGHYSGDIILAFSVANSRVLPRLGTDDPPLVESFDYIVDHYMGQVYEAAVQAVEEAIINALVAAETVDLVKPAGEKLQAIDHEQLRAAMKKYNRLSG